METDFIVCELGTKITCE